jgi:dienelactone hydrolase
MLFAIVMCCASGETEMAAKITKQEVDYKAGETTLKGYLVYDASIPGKRPGVIVVHEWWGHNDYARKRAEMLAELGYTALAIDMYGDGKLANHPDDAMKFAMATLSNAEEAKAKFMAGIDVLKGHESTDSERIAAIGYCFGGGVVLNMARLGVDLDAVVSFHGSLQAVSPVQEGMFNGRMLVCNGAADPMVSQEQIIVFETEMNAAGIDYEVVNYDGAQHSFTNPLADSFGSKFSLPLSYNEAADKQSWEAMKKLFGEVFGS